MKYSACLETLFQNSDLIRRIYRAKKIGFPSVEFWVWQTKDIKAIKKVIDDTDMEVGIFQEISMGKWLTLRTMIFLSKE